MDEGNLTGRDENETGTLRLRVLMWVLLPLEAIWNGETHSKQRSKAETGEGIKTQLVNLTRSIMKGVPTGQEGTEKRPNPFWSSNVDETGTIAVGTSKMGGAHQTSHLACLQEQ